VCLHYRFFVSDKSCNICVSGASPGLAVERSFGGRRATGQDVHLSCC